MLMKKTSTKQFAIRIRCRTLSMIHAPLFYSNSLYDVDKTYALEQKRYCFYKYKIIRMLPFGSFFQIFKFDFLLKSNFYVIIYLYLTKKYR